MQQMAPPQQSMDIAKVDAVYIRQKLQVFENFCPICEKKNKYHVASIPAELAAGGPPPTDEMFFGFPQLGEINEESTTFCRICCGKMRELKLSQTDPQGIEQWKVDRPFKCTMLCCCCLLFPQEATIKSPDESVIGKAVMDWSCGRLIRACCCGEMYTRVEDSAGQTMYFLRETYPVLCNGCKNCLAPTCFNESKWGEILDPMEQEVGRFRDIYPGRVGCRCLSDATNYTVLFPTAAPVEHKNLLLGALMLNEFLYHEKPGGAAQMA